ncbi:MAG TPA: hypothetical protein PLU35_04745 [Phycisphaerales bacterium]|nr:hypothetical protein [Phycisphaerales bacterium]
MRRGAFTLFEVLVAIALLIAAASLAAPALARRMGAALFDESSRQLEGALALCRAEALREGRPVALVAQPARDGLRLLARPLGEDDPVGGLAGASGSGAGWFVSPGEGGASSGGGPGVPREFPVFVLPSGVRVSAERPVPAEAIGLGAAGAGSEFGVSPMDSGEAAYADGPLTIAVFLPDGGALETAPFWLIGPEGRSVEVRISAATGRATLRAVRGSAPADRAEASAFEVPAGDGP